jgi:dTDP-4-dehydrorhamnose 3,5-epimerase
MRAPGDGGGEAAVGFASGAPGREAEGRFRDLARELPHGVRLRALEPHADARGSLTEVYRQVWKGGAPPVQWNAVRSEPGVMRGVHIHLGYDEYYLLLEGRLSVGYRDVRPGSPSEGRVGLVELSVRDPHVMMAPPGVAHGLLFHEPSLLLVATTRYWDPRNELGCHWLDPALGIPWPLRRARLSERDAGLPAWAEVAGRVPPWRG